MEKYKNYARRFFESRKKSRHYVLTFDDLVVFMEACAQADMSEMFHIVTTLFNFGYAKGYRAAMAEIKKGGAA